MGWTTPLAEGIPGLLVSPGRGLFLESPVLLLGLVGLLRAGRGSSARCGGFDLATHVALR